MLLITSFIIHDKHAYKILLRDHAHRLTRVRVVLLWCEYIHKQHPKKLIPTALTVLYGPVQRYLKSLLPATLVQLDSSLTSTTSPPETPLKGERPVSLRLSNMARSASSRRGSGRKVSPERHSLTSLHSLSEQEELSCRERVARGESMCDHYAPPILTSSLSL